MFSNDILSDTIVIKAVTEKTVRNLNLNFKFLSNGNFRWWAFRNYAYFVMKPSGCDTVRLRVWTLTSTYELENFACCCVGNFQIWILSPKKCADRFGVALRSFCSTFCVLYRKLNIATKPASALTNAMRAAYCGGGSICGALMQPPVGGNPAGTAQFRSSKHSAAGPVEAAQD